MHEVSLFVLICLFVVVDYDCSARGIQYILWFSNFFQSSIFVFYRTHTGDFPTRKIVLNIRKSGLNIRKISLDIHNMAEYSISIFAILRLYLFAKHGTILCCLSHTRERGSMI